MTRQEQMMADRLTESNGKPEYAQSHPVSLSLTETRWSSLILHVYNDQTLDTTDYWTWCEGLTGACIPVIRQIVVRQLQKNHLIACFPNELFAILWKLRWAPMTLKRQQAKLMSERFPTLEKRPYYEHSHPISFKLTMDEWLRLNMVNHWPNDEVQNIRAVGSNVLMPQGLPTEHVIVCFETYEDAVTWKLRWYHEF